MLADGNTYGSGQNPTPFVSESDYTAIQAAIAGGADQFPDDWTDDLTRWPNSGPPTDTITWQILPCYDVEDDSWTLDVATPFERHIRIR